MARATAAAAVAVALATGACGGGDDDGDENSQTTQRGQAAQPKRSALDCLDGSVLSPERSTNAKADAEPEVRPLITGGTRMSTILGGDELGGFVLEYPDVAAAGKAYDKALQSRRLAFLGKEGILLRGRVLFLDYAKDAHARKVVRGCAERPGDPPPTP